MLELTFDQIDKIKEDVSKADIHYSHLSDDLVDHICCDVENEMQKTGSFEEAYKIVKKKIGYKGLQEIQENTLLLIDKNYRIMKTTMKISGLIAPILMAAAGLFKIQHWPGAGIMLVLGFFVLIFFFLPSAIYINYKEVSNKTKKLVHISGFIGVSLFATGMLFKIQHWPGASILILGGILLSGLIFIPSLFISNYRQTRNKPLKLIYMLGMAGCITYPAGFLFKIMHWPGANILLMMGALLLICIVFPLYVFNKYKEETHINRGFIFLVIMVTWIIIPTILIRLSISKDYFSDFRVTRNETTYYIGHWVQKNQQLYAKINMKKGTNDSIQIFCNTLENRTNALCESIEGIKNRVMALDTDNIEGLSVADILIKNEEARKIKEQIINYREFLISSYVSDSATNIYFKVLLNTDDNPAAEGKLFPWEESELLSNEPLLTANRLLLLEEKARMAENTVLLSMENINQPQPLKKRL
jgi:hypothetical protein